MKYYTLEYLLIILKLTVLSPSVKAVGTTMGNYFLTQIPFIERDLELVFVTLSNHAVVKGIFNAPRVDDCNFESELTRLQFVQNIVHHMCVLNRMERLGFIYVIMMKSDGGEMFAVWIHLYRDDYYRETMPVIPVAGFGSKYYVVTSSGTDSGSMVIIIANENETMVEVTISRTYDRSAIIECYQQNDHSVVMPKIQYNISRELHFQILLEKHRAFALGDSGEVGINASIGLTGTVLKSNKPIGVVSAIQYGESRKEKRDAEMQLPVESAGTEILLVYPPLNREAKAYFLVLATEDDTSFTYSSASKVLAREGDFLKIAYDRHLVIAASKPIICFVQLERPNSVRALCMMVPTALFYISYVWREMSRDTSVIRNALYVIRQTDISKLVLGDGIVYNNVCPEPNDGCSKLIIHNIIGYDVWKVASLSVDTEAHTTYVSTGAKFGLYLYGTIEEGRDMQMMPGGFIAAAVNEPCKDSVMFMTPEDFIDNDCDGAIDEEILNNLDDDNDGSVDEDLSIHPTADGSWSPWNKWSCSVLCGYSQSRTRGRKCLLRGNLGRDCDGNNIEVVEEFCHTHIKCPEDCPMWTFGLNCTGSCVNCEEDCNKTSGVCTSCKAGWMGPLEACVTGCPIMTYGFECSKSCLTKCGQDCIDRTTGTCPADCPVMTYGVNCSKSCLTKCGQDCIDRTTGTCPADASSLLVSGWMLLLPLALATTLI